MTQRRANSRGQVTVELAVLFAVVIAALVFMAIYFQRGVQGGVRSNADSFGQQFSAIGAWTQTTTTNQHTVEDQVQVVTDQTQNLGYNQTLP
jgi:uncharacterized protein (UPF0333 family)